MSDPMLNLNNSGSGQLSNLMTLIRLTNLVLLGFWISCDLWVLVFILVVVGLFCQYHI